jgi:hypothetical protein
MMIIAATVMNMESDYFGEQLDDEGGFIRFFKSLPDIGADAVRIFDRGDWYTAHGEDAMFIAKTVRRQPHSRPSIL